MSKPLRAQWTTGQAVAPEYVGPASSRRIRRSSGEKPYMHRDGIPSGFRKTEGEACSNPECSEVVAFVHVESGRCLKCMIRSGWSPMHEASERSVWRLMRMIARRQGKAFIEVYAEMLRIAFRDGRPLAAVVGEADCASREDSDPALILAAATPLRGPAGSAERIEEMRRRAERGEELVGSGDRRSGLYLESE